MKGWFCFSKPKSPKKQEISNGQFKPTEAPAVCHHLHPNCDDSVASLARDVAYHCRNSNYCNPEEREEGSHDHPAVNVMTLAGDNNGASMTIRGATKKRDTIVPIRRGNNVVELEEKEDNNQACACEQNSEANIVNSNVQTIENSIMQDSSCNVRDSGVLLINEVKQGRPNRLTNRDDHRNLRFKKSCLKSLLMEPSSDSDIQNPRRHGCRQSCHLNN